MGATIAFNASHFQRARKPFCHAQFLACILRVLLCLSRFVQTSDRTGEEEREFIKIQSSRSRAKGETNRTRETRRGCRSLACENFLSSSSFSCCNPGKHSRAFSQPVDRQVRTSRSHRWNSSVRVILTENVDRLSRKALGETAQLFEGVNWPCRSRRVEIDVFHHRDARTTAGKQTNRSAP